MNNGTKLHTNLSNKFYRSFTTSTVQVKEIKKIDEERKRKGK